jgi:putative transposase
MHLLKKTHKKRQKNQPLCGWDIEELLAARGITVSVETVRNWCDKFGQRYCSQIRKNRGRLGDTWYLDEVFIKVNGVLHYLWRAVDQDGDELDILVQKRRKKGRHEVL